MSRPTHTTRTRDTTASDPQREPELPLHTPSLASLSMAALIALVAWLAFAAQTDILATVKR